MGDDSDIGITDADVAENEKYVNLGPGYFAARRVVQRYMEHFEAEHFRPLVDDIVKVAASRIRDEIWEDVEEWLLGDLELNLQNSMSRQVDDTVKALMTGKEWALKRYAMSEKYLDGQAIREAVAKHIPGELQDARIADLEADVKRLNDQLEWYRRT